MPNDSASQGNPVPFQLPTISSTSSNLSSIQKKLQLKKMIDDFFVEDSAKGIEDKSLPDSNIFRPSVFEVYEALLQFFPDIYRKRKDYILDSSSLPHRPPLKKRLADARYKDVRRDKRFTYGVFAVDKWKDIPAAMTVKLFWDCIVVDSAATASYGHVGTGGVSLNQGGYFGGELVFMLSDPSIQEWLDWIELGKLHPSLVSFIHEFNISIYHDGCVLVEIQDFRVLSNFSSTSVAPVSTPSQTTIKPAPISSSRGLSQDIRDTLSLSASKIYQQHEHPQSNNPPTGLPSATQSSQSTVNLIPQMLPEIHRILLKPNEASIARDLSLMLDEIRGESWDDETYVVLESRLRQTMYPHIVLDPSPNVMKLLNFAHFQSVTTRPYKKKSSFLRAYEIKNDEDVSLAKSGNTFGTGNVGGSLGAASYTRHLLTVQELRRSKRLIDIEPFHGLDSKKISSGSTSGMWSIPMQRIYRTVRMERSPDKMPKADTKISSSLYTCYSLHIIALPDGIPEAIVRLSKGTPDTSDNGETLRFKLPSVNLIEPYIQSFKLAIGIQDIHMVCVTDLTNPSCFSLFRQS